MIVLYLKWLNLKLVSSLSWTGFEFESSQFSNSRKFGTLIVFELELSSNNIRTGQIELKYLYSKLTEFQVEFERFSNFSSQAQAHAQFISLIRVAPYTRKYSYNDIWKNVAILYYTLPQSFLKTIVIGHATILYSNMFFATCL